jgi:hypothetical protein
MSKEEEVLDRGDEFDPEDEELEDEALEDEEDLEDIDEDEDEDDGEAEESDDEDEDDDEESDDEDDSDDEEDEEETSGRIPRSRLNEVIAQRDAEREAREREEERVSRLEAMVEKLISGQGSPKGDVDPPVKEYDFDAAEERYIDLILEGEVKDALALRKEIDNAKQDRFRSEIEDVRTSTKDSVLTQSKFDTAVEAMEAKYSFLDVESDSYNEEAVESINALMSGYINNGIDKVSALNKAVAKMAPMYDVKPPVKEPKLGGEKRKAASTEARKRNAKASKAQPPKSPGRRAKDQDLDTVVVAKLSERDFAKLTDREKRILRGD